MSEFFKAAARCDITIIRESPIPLDEKSIIEDEIKARQWDTLGSKIAAEKEIYDEIRSTQLDKQRQREQEERMRKLRLEEKRKEAVEKKETERAAKADMQRRKNEDLEMQRLSIIEQRRQELAADRAKARKKAEEKAYEEVQRRLQTLTGPKSIEEQGDELPEDSSKLSYLDRIRIEKERLGRMKAHYPTNTITALYDNDAAAEAAAAPKTKTRLERDFNERRERERKRIEDDHKQLLKEDTDDIERERSIKKSIVQKKKTENEEWLRTAQRQEAEEQKIREEKEREEIARKNKRHPIDDMHKLVEKEFLDEQEAIAVVEDNLTMNYSHLDRLEQFMDAEKDAWREQLQYEKEIEYEQAQQEYY